MWVQDGLAQNWSGQGEANCMGNYRVVALKPTMKKRRGKFRLQKGGECPFSPINQLFSNDSQLSFEVFNPLELYLTQFEVNTCVNVYI